MENQTPFEKRTEKSDFGKQVILQEKSEPDLFSGKLKYLHRNPVEVSLVEKEEEFFWSSFG
jgi:hypothetical protein